MTSWPLLALAAALLSTGPNRAPRTPYSSFPVCSESASPEELEGEPDPADSDEEPAPQAVKEEAPVAKAVAGPALSLDSREPPVLDCSEPPPQTPPAVVDCNDLRASIWVQEMIGSCDMPRTAPHPSLRSGRGHGESVICDASGCWREPLPIRAAAHNLDGTLWGIAPDVSLNAYFRSTRLSAMEALPLRSHCPPLRERPPRA